MRYFCTYEWSIFWLDRREGMGWSIEVEVLCIGCMSTRPLGRIRINIRKGKSCNRGKINIYDCSFPGCCIKIFKQDESVLWFSGLRLHHHQPPGSVIHTIQQYIGVFTLSRPFPLLLTWNLERHRHNGRIRQSPLPLFQTRMAQQHCRPHRRCLHLRSTGK